MTVREVLSRLKVLLGSRHVEINMRNNRFIDKIISDNPEKEFSVRIPESDLDRFISQNPELRRLSYKTLFHKCFFENIDDSFPYGDFTLRQVGIPLYDVIQVSTDTAMAYVELSADAAIFN